MQLALVLMRGALLKGRVEFVKLIVALTLIGMAKSQNIWGPSVYGGIANKNSPFGRLLARTPGAVVLRGIGWLTHKVGKELADWAHVSTAPATHALDGQAQRRRALNQAHAAFAENTAQGFHDLRHKVMVPYVRNHIRPVMRHAVRGEALGERSISLWRKETNTRRRSISHINTKLGALALGFLGIDYLVKRHHARSHQHAHLHTIPQTAAQVGRTKAQVRAHARRISRLEKLLGVTALTAVMTAILARTIPSWRCSNFRNIRRLLRCSHWRWLEAMLFLAVDALVVRDLCLLVGYVERGATAFQPVIHSLVVAGENFICGDPRHMPSAITARDRADSPGFASAVVASDLAL